MWPTWESPRSPARAPNLRGVSQLVACIKKRRPRLAVLIDFPDVNLRLARELKTLSIPVIYFVSPQLVGLETSSPPLGAGSGSIA